MHTKSSPGVFVILVIMALLFVFPFVYMIGGSLKTNQEALTSPATLFPSQPYILNYYEVGEVMDFPIMTWNSSVMTFGVTFLQILVSALAGYAFARIKFIGRDIIFVVFLAMLVVPFEILFVPLYLMMAKWGWINTFWALIIPSVGNPFAIFLFRQYFLTIPTELDEAMVVDGAGYLRIFWSLMLPLSGPAVASVFILTFLAEWSTLLKPMLFTTSEDMRTLQVGLQFLNRGGQVSTPTIAWLLAGITIVSIPAVIIFLILQRYFVASTARTGIAGR
jgi:multiple sugar transport system permease protein